jgi:hypothetical protein
MFYFTKRRTEQYQISNGFARLLLMAAAVIALPGFAKAGFFVFENQGDPNFNQLLGINDANSPAAQTKAIGINNLEIPEIVGSYTDGATGFTHGFLDVEGVQLTVDDPAGVNSVKTPVQKLLGINNNDKAVGFWTDNSGKTHGFVVLITPKTHVLTFVEIGPNYFPGAVATQVTGITNNHTVCGFWTDTNNNNHGFYAPLGGALMARTSTAS